MALLKIGEERNVGAWCSTQRVGFYQRI